MNKRIYSACVATSTVVSVFSGIALSVPQQAQAQQRRLPPPPPPVVNLGPRKAVPPPPSKATTTTKADPNAPIVIYQSKPLSTTALTWQNLTDYINLQAGQDQLPLTLTFTNGPGGTPKIQRLAIDIAGRRVATNLDFKGDTLVLDMTGALSGSTQIEIEAYGPPGASINWKLTTPKIKLSSMAPDTAGPTEKVVLTGKGLPKSPKSYRILVADKTATVVDVTDKTLTFTVPQDAPGGKQVVQAYVGNIKLDPFNLVVKVPPEVTSCNMFSIPPLGTMQVYGKNFSKNAAENQIFFNGMPGTIVNGSDTQLTVQVPNLDAPQFNVAITVKTNGMASKGNVIVNVSAREVPKDFPDQSTPDTWKSD